MIKKLSYLELKNIVDKTKLDFKSTKTVEAGKEIIGQDRAKAAFALALSIKSKGYNIYASGLPGTGKTTFATQFAQNQGAQEAIPPDLCYVYNFKEPKLPKALKLKAGVGKVFKAAMEELVETLKDELPKVFSAKDFEVKKNGIVKIYQDKRDEIIKVMTIEAKEQQFGVKTTNSGIYFMPIVNDEVISEEQFDLLEQEEKDKINKLSEVIQKQAQDAMREIKSYERQTRKEVEDLEYSVGLFTVGHLIGELLEKFEAEQSIVNHLLELKEDVLESLADFLEEESDEDETISSILPWVSKKSTEDNFTKYYVNLIADNSTQTGAPVVVDYNPTYSNLVGETEFDNEYGNLTTDFMKIKPGLFHKANGGYLILQAHDVFSNVHAWETIRRVLLTEEIVIEPLREYATGFAMSSIKPDPIACNVKVIMVGTGYYYEVLQEYDDEFQKLFKVCADFDYEMNYNNDNLTEVSKFVKKIINKNSLLEFETDAVVAVVEFSGRMCESQEKLSTRFNQLSDILIEASTWAKLDGKKIVKATHVKQAIFERENRFKLYEDKLTEMLEKNFIMIDTQGWKVGQINGLAVIDMGEYAFAKPTRITATTYVGKAGIVNIEQESDLSGPIHDKGVQVLTGYLGQTYAQNFPLSLSCRVCFEQNYSGIDGDSASSTELYAILSSLSKLPINQEIAVTGSINQRGEIQPIGGVIYKIEGFFDLCKSRGLTGNQGVLIPLSNVKDLMLNDEVIAAVKAETFHIYAIETIADGIEILTGVKAGEMDENEKFEKDTVNGKVQKRLKNFFKKSLVQ